MNSTIDELSSFNMNKNIQLLRYLTDGDQTVAACGGISRQPYKVIALRPATRTTTCRFGRTRPMPAVNSRTIYQCARNYAR